MTDQSKFDALVSECIREQTTASGWYRLTPFGRVLNMAIDYGSIAEVVKNLGFVAPVMIQALIKSGLIDNRDGVPTQLGRDVHEQVKVMLVLLADHVEM